MNFPPIPRRSLAACMAIFTAYGAVVMADTADNVREGITKTMQAHFQACNRESLPDLLATMSTERPQYRGFESGIDASWSVNDAYTVLDDVEVLAESDAPDAQFEPPYATAAVTETVIELKVGNERVPAFRRKCEKPDSDPVGLAMDSRLASRIVTTRVELLFKHEGGEWKVVKAITDPEVVNVIHGNPGTKGLGVPTQQRVRVSRSAFK